MKPTTEDLERVSPDLRKLLVPLEELELDPENPRLHPDENVGDIMASLEAYGQQKPVVTSSDGRGVIAGNGTVLAARRLGWRFVARVRSELDGVKVRGYKIADNRTAETSAWNEAVLGRELVDLAGGGLLEARYLGFSDEEVLRWRDRLAFPREGMEYSGVDPGHVEEPEAPASSTAGRMQLTFTLTPEVFSLAIDVLKEFRDRFGCSSEEAFERVLLAVREAKTPPTSP